MRRRTILCNKSCLIKILMVFFLLCVGIQQTAFASTQEIVAEGSYIMGDSESVATAKKKARIEAMRIATEKAGVYVKSYTEVKELEITADEIKTMAASFMKIIEQNCVAEPLGDTVRYVVHIKALVDNTVLDEMIKRDNAIREQKANEEMEKKRYSELDKKYNILIEELSKIKKQSSLDVDRVENEKYKELELRYNQLNEELIKIKNHPQKSSDVDEDKRYKELEERYNKLSSDFEKIKQQSSSNNFVFPNRVVEKNNVLMKKVNLHQTLEDANNLMNNEDYEGAINKLVVAKNSGTQEPNLNRLLGLAYYRNEKYFEAMLCYRDALQAITDNGQWYKEYGDILYTRGRYKEALKAYDRAIELDKSMYAAYANRGATYWSIGQIDKAIEEYNKAVSINKKDNKVYIAKRIMEGSYICQSGQYIMKNAVKILPLV